MCLLTEQEKYVTGMYWNVREEGDKGWRWKQQAEM
jgi:hypothetical protein